MAAELAQTWLTVMRGTEVNRFGDETDVGVPVQRHVPASMAETSHVTFDHRQSQSEPLLWAADVVCWAVGAGAIGGVASTPSSRSSTSTLVARHPATLPPESEPGALPSPSAAATLIIPDGSGG